jgi:hypothetical protein
VHSLEPLVYAFKPGQILMINEPSICMGALWIPYRRDPAVMKAVLGQCASAPEISMVFCHADVRGAYMNDNMRSKEGLDITCFPKDLPIYSGHFHKPHTVCMGQVFARVIVLRSLSVPPDFRAHTPTDPEGRVHAQVILLETLYCWCLLLSCVFSSFITLDTWDPRTRRPCRRRVRTSSSTAWSAPRSPPSPPQQRALQPAGWVMAHRP